MCSTAVATSGVRCRIICNESAHEAMQRAHNVLLNEGPNRPIAWATSQAGAPPPRHQGSSPNSALAVLQMPSSCAWQYSADKMGGNVSIE